MIYYPFLGALALASGALFQKIVLRKKRIGVRLYHCAEFLALILVMLPFVYFFWSVDSQAFTSKNLFVFFLVVLFSIIANLLTVYSMKWEKLSNLEPAKLLEPLFTIILAIVFSYIFGEILFERNTKIIIPALIAGVALVLSHIKRYHFSCNKYFLSAILGSFFFALELVISKLILGFYSPITFYFLRNLVIFLIIFTLFKPKFREIDKKTRYQILGLGALWVLYRVIVYHGYLKLGIIFTTLLIMLSPIFIYFFAWKFLKEKISRRNILASVVIVCCVVYVVIS